MGSDGSETSNFVDDPLIKEVRKEQKVSLEKLLEQAKASDSSTTDVTDVDVPCVYRPDDVDDMWDALAPEQYKPIERNLNEVAPMLKGLLKVSSMKRPLTKGHSPLKTICSAMGEFSVQANILTLRRSKGLR